jgi:hypothetical protein
MCSPHSILPAQVYQPVNDLWVLSSYFNPNDYETKRKNYDVFASSLDRSGINYLVVECAFPGQPFKLPPVANIIRTHAQTILWQKERLLNIALSFLPPECTKVAWLDCDILFENPAWAVEASSLLEECAVVQLFDRAVRLPKDFITYNGVGDMWEGFAAVYQRRPNLLLRGDFAKHGHTGFGWAARRTILERYGLYDACISGSGDHMMAHSFCGDWESECIDRILGSNTKHREHFVAWSKEIYKDVRARVKAVSGTVLHLWHGDMKNRNYVLRNQELARFRFNPFTDLRLGLSGCWELSSNNEELRQWAINYYASRNEDE